MAGCCRVPIAQGLMTQGFDIQIFVISGS